MNKGIRFYRCVWDTGSGYQDTTEAAYSRRHLADKIRVIKNLDYQNSDGSRWKLLKIQEFETPMIELEWLLNLFTSAGNKKEREAHRDQAAYIIRLIEAYAARVLLEDGTVIER